MNIVTLFILILGIGSAIAILMFARTAAMNYLEENRFERKKEMKEKEIQEKMFDDEMDEIDRELERDRNN